MAQPPLEAKHARAKPATASLKRWGLWSAGLLLVLLLAGCSPLFVDVPRATPTPTGQYPIDPNFRELYYTLGGEAVLGAPISPPFTQDTRLCQYTANALMCFNPQATDVNRLGLAPIGQKFGLQDAYPAAVTALGGSRVVDGFVIYEEFLPLYDRLYGARYTGRPLTSVRINYDSNRYEQYFENVGFYRPIDAPGQVRLIPYGSILYPRAVTLEKGWGQSIIGSAQISQPFASSLVRIGGAAQFGKPLTKPYRARDGSLEQVYENAVFYAPPGSPGQMRVRPLVPLLGIPAEPLEPPIQHPQLVFYEVEKGLGHNVPLPFDQFIARHGSKDLSGKPLTEVSQVEGQNLYRQCFENYCLDYDPTVGEELRVRITPLGREYLARFSVDPAVLARNPFSQDTIQLQVAAARPQVSRNEEQRIHVLVTSKKTQEGIENIEATLMVTLPDGASLIAPVPPTRADGTSIVTIPAQPGVKNGSMVGYQVCLRLPSEKPICESNAYLIWGSP
ncbi:MAG TPA: hypothetical protein VIO61_01000 [Anaerolineaceae bacterium]